jgi:hypothetical protein
VHNVVQFATWAVWDAAPMPGKPYPRPVPPLWPVVSFPVFSGYGLLTGDRDMFHTFDLIMYGNSVVWGVAACAIVLALLKRRQPATA